MPLGSVRAVDGQIGYGIAVGGVPVGDTVYVRAFQEEKVGSATSKMNSTLMQLRDVHTPSLWTCLYYAMQPLYHHWIQHCYPSDSRSHAERIDAALLEAATACVPGLRLEVDITAH